MKVTWMPLTQYGETFYLCTVEEFGHVAQGTSRRKPQALAFALEELARLVATTGVPDP